MAEKLNRYPVNWPIRCNGKLYPAGDTIALDSVLYAQLKTTGAIAPEPVAELARSGTQPLTPEQRAAAIREAAAKLKKTDFTADDKPEVKAIEKAVGFDTTREEIDAALAAAS